MNQKERDSLTALLHSANDRFQDLSHMIHLFFFSDVNILMLFEFFLSILKCASVVPYDSVLL